MLIPMIDHYLDGNQMSTDNSLMLGYYLIAVESEGVYIQHVDTPDTNQLVPLADFKVIAQAWADFQRNQ